MERFEAIDTTTLRGVPVVWHGDTIGRLRGAIRLGRRAAKPTADSARRVAAAGVFDAAVRLLGPSARALGPLPVATRPTPADTFPSGLRKPLTSPDPAVLLIGEWALADSSAPRPQSPGAVAVLDTVAGAGLRPQLRVRLVPEADAHAPVRGQLWLGQPLAAYALH